MNILIIEDEALAAKRLQRLLGDIAKEHDLQIMVVGVCESIAETIAWVHARQEKNNAMPDLALCDIHLGDGQSFEIFERVAIDFPIIFTTAFDEYALKAFKLHSIDYLLKPIKKEELYRALQKYQKIVDQMQSLHARESVSHDAQLMRTMMQQLATLAQATQPQQEQAQYRSRFLVRHGDGFLSVMIEDIAYFYSEHKITHLVRHDGKRAILDEPLDELITMLNPRDFYRANRQVIVSPRSLSSIHRYFNGKLKLPLVPREPFEVLVSKESASEFKTWLDR